MTRTWLVLIVLGLACCITACALSSSDDDDDDDLDGERLIDNGDGSATDSSTGLMWQTALADCAMPLYVEPNHDGAIAYCDDLTLADHDDWRLPTISELRSLVRGCEGTEIGGACKITDGCREYDARVHEDCTCEAGEGPNNNCYGPKELDGECYCFWSSTRIIRDGDYRWTIHFLRAEIDFGGTSAGDDYWARCVR